MIEKQIELELKKLNEQQREAVMHEGGPLFVVAGAGTGKTKTLTTRIAYLINVLKVHPNAILGVTFTNKAAREIRTRVNDLVFPDQMGSWLYTFHAFGLNILRRHASELQLGYQNDFMVIDEDDAITIIRDVIKKINFDIKEFPPRMVKSLISDDKTKIQTILDDNIQKIYDKYQETLIKEQLMDFDDLIVYTHRLFRDNKTIREYYQNQFDHILIDEFQDTDRIQYEIIKFLNNPNTFVVGDPDQSIYAFRGARYENNELFIKDFNAKTIVLEKNYRSKNNILKAANKLIANNQSRATSKNLVSDYGDGEQVVIYLAQNDFEEVRVVTNEIIRLTSGYCRYEDIAVLYRSNHLSRQFEHGFTQSQIPYTIYGGISFYERKEVKDMLAYLKLIVDDKSNFYLKRVINVPARGLGNVTIGKLEDYADFYGMSMFEAIDKIDLPAKALNSLKEFKELIINLRERINSEEDVVAAIDAIFYGTNYQEVLKEEIDEKAKERKENIFELKSVLRSSTYDLETSNLEKIKKVLDEIALYTDHDKKTTNDNVVKLATIHQVKGLEFKVVFVVAMEEGIFPNDRFLGDYHEMEEERRIFYVALTRAKERLYITHTERRMLYGKMNFNRPSRFLNEIRRQESEEKATQAPKRAVESYSSGLKTGDIIEHDVFGKGVVVEIKEEIATIAFNVEHGIKKLMASHPSIKKI